MNRPNRKFGTVFSFERSTSNGTRLSFTVGSGFVALVMVLFGVKFNAIEGLVALVTKYGGR